MRTLTSSARLERGLAAGLIAVAALAGVPAGAQESSPVTTRLIAGMVTPIGDLKDWYGSGGLAGMQATWHMKPWLATTASMSWANAPTRRRDGIPDFAVGWTYDLGLEGRVPGWKLTLGSSTDLAPFAGAGFGSRAYYLPTSMQGSTTGLAGYGAAGLDAGRRGSRWGVRFETRAYRTSFTDVQKSIARTDGTDIAWMVGIARR